MKGTAENLERIFNLKNKVAVVIGGGGHLCGSMAEGLAMAGSSLVIVDMRLEKAKNILTDAVQSKDELRITVADGASKIPEYINKLISEGIEVSTVSASKPTLDDVFLEVTGNRLEGNEKPTEEEPTTTRKRRGR